MSARSRSASNAGVEEIPPPELISPLTVCFNNTLNGSDNSGEFEASFLEIVEHIVSGEKKSSYFCNVLRAIGYAEENAKISLILANILWFAGTQVNQATEIDKWNNLCATVKDYGNSGLVDTSILRQTLEFNLLHGAQLTKEDPVLLNKKLVKVRTALYFKQQKYNLLREEPEGFSKLAVVLNSMPEYPQDCSAYVKNVCSLIGTFDLCPNRVLDVTLDAFETRPHNLNFVTLLKKFKRDNIAHMLGFKFCFYQEEYERESAAAAASADGKTIAPAAAAGVEKKGGVVSLANTAGTSKNREIPGAKTVAEDPSKTNGAPPAIPSSDTVPPLQRPQAAPASLYALAATLIMSDMVQIADLVPYLAPTAEATKGITAEIEKACRKQVTSYGVISLNAAANAAAATTAAAVPVTPAVPRDVGSAAVSQEVTSAATSREARSAAPAARGGSGSSASAGGGKPPPPSGPPPVVGQYSSTVATSVAGSSAGSVDGKDDLLIGSPEFDEQLSLFYEEETFHRPNLLYAEGNQFIGLATALINLRGWSQALVILSYLESAGVVEAVRYSVHLRQAIIDLALYAIDDVYQSISVQKLHLSARNSSFGRFQQGNKGSIFHPPVFPQPQLQPITSLQTFPVELLPLLDALSYHLGESNVLFTRLCRLSAAWIKTASEQAQVDTAESGGVPLSEVLEPVITLLTTNLLPSLSVCPDSNAYLAAQLWSPVSLLPFDIRFRVYDAWKGAGLGKDGLNSKPSSVALAETKALHSTKAVLKRLAKENVKSIGRQLCKITPMNPIVVFNYVLSTIEVFDNLIPYMVDALKYSTELARDCMAYCLVTQLKKENSGKLKKGDTHYSSWFSALSKFIAMFYCRYPTTELKGLFHYLLSVLSEGDSLDLLVLKELLVIMGGCETLLEVSAIQLEGLAGGRVLRQEMMGVTTTMIASSGISVNNNKKATIALREELMTSKTALPLLLFIAQIRGAILYDTPSSETQLKLISHLFDITQDVLMQFTDFLVAGAKSVEHIALLMPSLDTLVKEVGLAVPIAFQLVRPIVRNALSFALQQQTAQADSSSTTLSSMPAYLQPWDPFSSSMLSNVQAYVPATVWSSLTPQLYLLFWSLSQYDIQTPINRYNLEIKRVKDRYTELDNKKYSSMMSNPLTGAPYTSSEISKLNRQREADMARLMTSMTALNEEMSKQLAHVEVIKSLIAAQKDSYFLQQPAEALSEEAMEVMEVVEAKEEEPSAVMVVETTAAEATSESIEMAVDDAATPSSAAALDATTAAVAVVETGEVNEDGEMTLDDGGSASILKDDEEFAEDENGDVIIVKKKGGASSTTAAVPAKAPIVLLAVDTSTVNVVATNVMQELVYNRVLMSPIDAVYCTQFLLLLHDNETPHFSLLHCYDKMVKTIAPLIFCTTEVEASFIGYALSDMLATVNRWVSNKGLFRTEFQGKLGSRYSVDRLLPSDLVAKLKVKADAAAAAAEKEGQVVDEGVTYETFVELTKVWHTKLFTVIMSTLAAKEYMFIRCALILLAKVTNLFPIRAVEGRKILLLVEQLSVTEKERVDLQLMARSLTTMLKKTVWIDEKPAAKKEKKVVKNMSEIDLLNTSAATAANKRDTAAPNGRDRDVRDSRGADSAANTNIREDASGKWSRGDNLQPSSSSSNLHGKENRDYGRSSEGVREGRDGQRDGRDAGRDTTGRDATTRDTRDGTANSRASRTGTAPVSTGQSDRDRAVPAVDRNTKPAAPSGQSDREARDARSARNAEPATNKDSTHKDAKVSKESKDSKDSSSKDKEKSGSSGAAAAAPLSGVKRKTPPESGGASDGKHNEGAAATGASSMASASKSQKVSNSSATASRDSGRDGNNKDNATSRPPQQRSDSRERSDSRSRAPNTASTNNNPPTTATKRPHEQISKDSAGNSSGKVNGSGRDSRDARDAHSSGSGNQQNQNQPLRRSDSRDRVEAAAAPNNSAHLSREPRDNRTSSSNTPAASAAIATETKTGKKVSATSGKDHKEGKDAKEKGEDSKRRESVKDSSKDNGGKDANNKDTSNKDGGKDREAKSSSDKEKTNESTDKGSSKKTNNDASSKVDAGSSSASTGTTAFAADLQRESDAKNAARQSRFGKPTPAGSAVEIAKPVVSAMLSKLNSSIGSGEATSSPRGSDRADTSTPRTNGNHSNSSAKVSTGSTAEKTPTTASATSSSRDADGKSDGRKPATPSTTTTTPSPAAGKIVEVKKVSTAKKAATPTKEAASATADRSDNKSDSVTVAVPTSISSATSGDNNSVSSAGGPKTKRPRSDSRSDAPPPAAVSEKAAEKASGSDKSAVDVLAPPVTSFGKTNKPRPASNEAVVRAVSEPILSSTPSSEAPSAAEPTVMTEAERRRKERLNGAGAKKPKVETAPANPPNPFTGTAPPPPASEPPRDNRGFSGPQSQGQPRHSNSAPGGNYRNKQHQQQPQSYAPPVQMVPSSQFIPQFQMGPPAVYQTQQSALVQLNQQPQRGNTRPPPPPGPSSYQQPHPQGGYHHDGGYQHQGGGQYRGGNNNQRRPYK